MRKKIVAVLTLFVMLTAVFLFAGCNSTKSCEAVIYNNEYSLVNEDFLQKNMTYGAYYIDENSETKQDTTSPKTRTFIFANEDECREIIDEGFLLDVNFNKEVLVLYIFTDTRNHWTPYWLTNASVKDKVLNIGITLHQTPKSDDDIVPAYQRWILVRMKKVAFESVEVYEVTENTTPHNAILYDRASSYMREEFLKENMTYWAFYAKWNYYNETLLDSYTYIVTNEEEYDKIFTDFVDVDFEKEVLVVYVFTEDNLYHYRVADIRLKDNVLNVDYVEQDLPGFGGGLAIFQRCFVLKMDKTEFESVEFKQISDFYALAYE